MKLSFPLLGAPSFAERDVCVPDAVAGRRVGILTFRRALLRWFRAHRRDFPWRRSRDPYRIWLAEVMLQQTRIAAVLPYYRRFLRRFPNVRSLARALQREVLRAWSGLGYYSRACNLHRAAKLVVARHSGKFPCALSDALALPGVGRYTAAAVLSIAYDSPLAVLDGNVARVLARLGALRGDLRAPRRWRSLELRATELLAPHFPGEWNQALMELGETVCTPQSPRCSECPVARWCRARALGLVEKIPAPRKKRSPVAVTIAAAVLLDSRGRTFVTRDPGRHDAVLFSRMWQFPAIEVHRHPAAELSAFLAASYRSSAKNSATHASDFGSGAKTSGFPVSTSRTYTVSATFLSPALDPSSTALTALPSFRHSVTYRKVALLPFLLRVSQLPRAARGKIVPLAEISRLPVSSATRKIAAAALRSLSPQ
ncbi:MAG: A/G-specific adenine glycosylase [Candidatus Acidiferrales bacterium]